MRHTDQEHMMDEMLNKPDGMVVESRSRKSALYISGNGDAVFVDGDFSGSKDEVDDRVRRFAKQMKDTSRRK